MWELVLECEKFPMPDAWDCYYRHLTSYSQHFNMLLWQVIVQII